MVGWAYRLVIDQRVIQFYLNEDNAINEGRKHKVFKITRMSGVRPSKCKDYKG